MNFDILYFQSISNNKIVELLMLCLFIYINHWSDTINHVIPKANVKYWIYYEITHVSHVQTNSAETCCVLEGVVFCVINNLMKYNMAQYFDDDT